MFDYTSAYNSPVNAVQRYKNAGLNPNLLTGQTQQAGSTGSIGQGNAPVPFTQMNADLSSNANATLLAKKVDNENKLMESQADLARFKAVAEMYKGLNEKTKAEYAPPNGKIRIGFIRATSSNRKNKSNLLSEQAITEVAKRLNISYDNMVKINTAINLADENKNIKATYKEIVSRVGLNKANAAILSLQAEKMRIEKPMWHSEAYNRCSLIMQQAAQYGKITDAQLEEYKANVKKLKAEAQSTHNQIGLQNYTLVANMLHDGFIWMGLINDD